MKPKPTPEAGTPFFLNTADRLLGGASALFQRAFVRRVRYPSVAWDGLARDLGDRFGADAARILAEPALAELEARTLALLAEIRPADPFRRTWAADSVLTRCCYLVCRLVKPRFAVETGVAYGVSSAFLLRAMEENGFGELHSIDLAPPTRNASRFRGIAVPEGLRQRWTLHPGSSRRLLAPLLDRAERTGGLDFFLHDSLHTRANMRREFAAAWPRLRSGGVLVADDVERNGAFGDLPGPALWRVVADRETEPFHGPKAPVTFGLAVK